MRKTALAIIALSLMTTALVGCSSSTTQNNASQSNSQTSAGQSSMSLSVNGQSQSQSQAQSQPASDPKEDPASVSAVQAELSKAFNIDAGMIPLTTMAIMQIAEGSQSLPLQLDQKHRLDLAKEITSASNDIGYEQNDYPPDLFLAPDGTAFAVGLKKASGQLLLNTYVQNNDGSWKLLKKETKQGTTSNASK